MTWERCRGTPYHHSLQLLPMSMQIDVAYSLYESELNMVKIFDLTNKTMFLRQVAMCLTHSVYLPGVHIVKEGNFNFTITYHLDSKFFKLTVLEGISIKFPKNFRRSWKQPIYCVQGSSFWCICNRHVKYIKTGGFIQSGRCVWKVSCTISR